MSSSTKKLFTCSKAPSSAFDKSDPTSFALSQPQLIEDLNTGGVAVITVLSPTGRLTSLFSPFVVTDEHNVDHAIQGNLSDDMSVPRFAQIPLTELGYTVSFTTKKPSLFSTGNKISGIKVRGGRAVKGSYARVTPNFIVMTFGQKRISGNIHEEETISNVESWCAPAAAILHALGSAMSNGDEDEALFEAISAANREDELLMSDFTAQRVVPKLPCVNIDIIDEEDDDAEIHHPLLELFKLRVVNDPPSQPPQPVGIQPASVLPPHPQPASVLPPHPLQTSTQSNTNQQVILVRTEDSNKSQIQAQDAQARLSLFYVAAEVSSDLNPVTANDLSKPVLTTAFTSVLQNHSSIRQEKMSNLISSVSTVWGESKRTLADLDVVPDTLSKAIIAGCLSRQPLSQRLSSTVSSKEVTILSFGPQTNNPDKVQQIRDYKEKVNAEQLNDVPDSQRTQVTTDIPSFGNISEVGDTLITIDNFQMVSSAIVEMANQATRKRKPIVLQLYQNLDDFMQSRRVVTWLRQYVSNMRWLPSTITVLLQNVFCAFAKLSKSFIAVEALTSNSTDAILRGSITADDLGTINGAIATVKQFKSAIDTAIGSNAALSEQIHCPQIERKAIDAEHRKRPVSASAPEGRVASWDGRGGPSHQPRFNTQRSNRANQRERKEPVQLGMFFLCNTNMSNDNVFPNDATCLVRGKTKKLCPDFSCVGKACQNGFDCEFAHVTNYSKLNQQVFDSICSHFHKYNIGWLSAGMLEKQSKVTLNNQFTTLKGDENGKFNTRG